MEIKGKLMTKLPLQTGEGAKGTWKKQTFIIQTEGDYPKDVAIIAWGEVVDKIEPVTIGSVLNCFVNVESRVFNDKWYTDVKLWKFDLESKGTSDGRYIGGTIKQSDPVNMDVPPLDRTPIIIDDEGYDELPF